MGTVSGNQLCYASFSIIHCYFAICRDHVDDYDDDNDGILDIHDEDDDGDGIRDLEVKCNLQRMCITTTKCSCCSRCLDNPY